MKMNHRHFVLIIFAAITIVVVCVVYFIIYKQTIVQANHYVSANTELVNEDSIKQKETDLRSVYDDTKEQRDSLISFLISEDKAVTFIEMVEKVGSDSGTKLELGSIANVEDILKANVTVAGSWTNVMTALQLLENLPVSSVIYNVNLNSSSELEKSTKIWTMTLNIEALTIK